MLYWNPPPGSSHVYLFFLILFTGYPTLLNPLRPDSNSVASSIKYHAEFTPLFSPEGFSLPKAFYATAQSVRDALIVNWNATYEYYDRMNMKQAYYLSMEFLQVGCVRLTSYLIVAM